MEIKPKDWILPNRIGYSEKIFKSFRPEFYEATSKVSCECDDKGKCDLSDKSHFPLSSHSQETFEVAS